MLGEIVAFGLPVMLSFSLAFLVESMTEYLFGILFDKFVAMKKFKWTLQYLSAGAGVGLCFHYQLDLMAFMQNTASVAAPPTAVGLVLTGLVIGRGANFVHQFVSQYFPKK